MIVLDKLYDSFDLLDICKPNTKSYSNNIKKENELTEKLFSTLNDKQKELFNAILKKRMESLGEEIEEMYKVGFVLGFDLCTELANQREKR